MTTLDEACAQLKRMHVQLVGALESLSKAVIILGVRCEHVYARAQRERPELAAELAGEIDPLRAAIAKLTGALQ